MRHAAKLLMALGLAGLAASVAVAQDDETPEDIAVEIRHGHMRNYASQLAVIGPMAQGQAEFDAAAAQRAADNLFHLASIDQTHYWLPGTAVGEHPESAALPAIWENTDDFEAKQQALIDAVTNLQSVAGTDLASLQGALGPVGQACGACHQTYRQQQQ